MGEKSLPDNGTPVVDGEHQGTTTFTTSVEAKGYDRHASSVDPMNDYDLEVDDIKNIADFLAKPMPVASGAFTTANTWGDLLYSGDLFTLLNAQTIWTSKIQGFLNMRGNVKLRLVINPTPFQAGLLRMSYFPCENQLQQEATAHVYNRKTISQLPGAYLSLKDNFVEITVPYIAPTSFLERDQVASGNHISWGKVYLHVFEILRTGTGPTSINWTLWMSIEDLELSGMVQPQMNDGTRSKGKRKVRPLAPQDREANSGKGPIGKIMSSGATLANDLSAIPILAPIAKPAAWVASAVGAFCDSLGWSKPTLTEGPCPQWINAHTYAVNTKGNDNAAPLSLDPDNKIMPISDASPGSLDEMSFNFVKTRWSYLSDLAWSSASVAGDLLYNLPVNPINFRESSIVGGNTVYTNTPCSVFAEIFQQYRGSFEFRVRLVKTGFHTGTLAVGFVPGLRALVPSYADSAYTYRQIIDIQDGDEFIFNLPYMIPQDYVNRDDSIGNFFIYVVNPLVAPATVSSTIDIFLEVRGGNDLVYAVPKGLTVSPIIPQGVDTQEEGESTTLTMGSRLHDLGNVHHASLSVGEIQQSLLEVLKANYNLAFNATSTFPTSGSGNYYIGTNRLYAMRYNGVTTTSSELGGDLISFVGSFYALQRGSQRWRIVPYDHAATNQSYRGMFLSNASVDGWSNGPALPGQTWWSADLPNVAADAAWSSMISSTNPAAGSGAAGYSNRAYQIPSINGGVAVQAPFYCKYRYELNHLVSAFGQSQLSFTTNNGVAFYTSTIARNLVTRALGDDFQFAYFVGIPCYTHSRTKFSNYT